MWQEKYLAHLDQNGGRREEKERRKEKEGGQREFRERHTTFFLNFSAIRLAVPGGARGKVLPSDKSYKWKSEMGVLKNFKR